MPVTVSTEYFPVIQASDDKTKDYKTIPAQAPQGAVGIIGWWTLPIICDTADWAGERQTRG